MNWYKKAGIFEGSGGLPADRFDVPLSQIGNIPVKTFVEKFVAPGLREKGIDGAEEYTYEIFGNLARLESGLDNRRAEDSAFYEYGPKIKAARDKAVKSYADRGRYHEFQHNLGVLVDLLGEYYTKHSGRKKIVKRKRSWELPEFDQSKKPVQYSDWPPKPPEPPKKSPMENYKSQKPLNPNFGK